MSRADVVVLFHALKAATHPEHIRELSAAQEVAERNGDLGGHVVCALYRVEELRSICDAFAEAAGVDAGYVEAMAEIRAMRGNRDAYAALLAAVRAYRGAEKRATDAEDDLLGAEDDAPDYDALEVLDEAAQTDLGEARAVIDALLAGDADGR